MTCLTPRSKARCGYAIPQVFTVFFVLLFSHISSLRPSQSNHLNSWRRTRKLDQLFLLRAGEQHSHPKQTLLSTSTSTSSSSSTSLQSSMVDLQGETNYGGTDPIAELREKLRGTCVYFVGMMGSGKSTLGDAFAKAMGYRFLDTDEIAEFMIEMPISSFFAQGRVDEFREVEYQILMELAQYTRVVVATGGGIVLRNDNWGLLRHGIVVFLDMPVEDIYERLKSDPSQLAKRPLLQEADPLAKLRKLHAERLEKYMQADIHLKISGEAMSPDALALYAARSILDFIAKNPPMWEEWKKRRDANMNTGGIIPTSKEQLEAELPGSDDDNTLQ